MASSGALIRYSCWAAVAVIKVVTLYCVVNYDTQFPFAFDSAGYLQIGYNLYHHGIFSISQDAAQLFPEFNRTPGYPLLIYTLWLGQLQVHWLLIFQVAVSIVAVIWVYQLAMLWFKHQPTAFLASIFYGLSPTVMSYDMQYLTDSLFAHLLLFFILSWSRKQLVISALSIVKLGLVLALLLLLRPVLLVLLPVFLFSWWRHNPRTGLGVFIFVFPILVFSLWSWRNAQLTNSFFYSNISNINLLYFNVANAEAKAQNISFAHAQQQIDAAVRAQFDLTQSHQVAAFNRYCYHTFLNSLRQQPLVHAIYALKNMIYFLFHPAQLPSSDIFAAWNSILRWTNVGLLVLLYLAIAWALAFGAVPLTLSMKTVLWSAATLMLTAAITDANARFRLPIESYLFIFGTFSLHMVFQQLKISIQR